MSDNTENMVKAISDISAQSPAAKALKGKIIIGVIAAVVLVAAIIAGAIYINTATKTETLSSPSLTKVVSISKLSTAELSYEGVADKYDGDDLQYHVYYKSTVTASTDMTKIDFSDIDNEKKVVRPKLPEIEIGDPIIDESSFDYIPDKPNAELKDVVSVCKEDARRDSNQNDLIMATAKRNLKQVVEALIKPILDQNGYQLDWSNVDGGKEENSDAAA